MEEAQEDQPLLQTPNSETWAPPRLFFWIEAAIMANVFLYGFDTTITASTYAVISSHFGAANMASWLTTSYLVTRCLGCGAAGDIVFLVCMRALSGLGGAGLMTMATIVNSDMIPFRKRGIYQAMQNAVAGFGAIIGASLGGMIADYIGWRWCFYLQVPISTLALVLGAIVLRDPRGSFDIDTSFIRSLLGKVDLSGALLLVTGISLQLFGLSLGGNELPWSSPWIIGCLITSAVLLSSFAVVEARLAAIPIIPPRMLSWKLPILIQLANNFLGLAAYAYLFMLPLYFQGVLLDSATTAGMRLIIPSLATPVGGLIAGIIMSRWGGLLWIVRFGAAAMVIGNGLVTSLAMDEPLWKYIVYIFPTNFGQGMVYPGILFTSLAYFEHADHAVSASTTYLLRSLGGVWGVSITSAIVQNTLSARLAKALSGIPDKEKIIEEIRHSVEAIRKLPPDLQLPARRAYHDGIRYAFATSTAFATLGLTLTFLTRGRGLRNTHK